MTARRQRVSGRDLTDPDLGANLRADQPDPNRPRENCFAHMFDEDPFPDHNLMELDETSKDEAQHKEFVAKISRTTDNEIETNFFKAFTDLF